MSKQFHPLADGEVVSIKNTCRVSELSAQIRSQVAATLAEWSNEQGIDGEALRFGAQGWEKGKIRLRMMIEFCPEDEGTAARSNSTAEGAVTTSGMATATMAAGNNAQAVHLVAVTPPTIDLPPVPSLLVPTVEPMAVSDQFDLGTMSDVSGEIDLNLLDEQGGYIDFDLSAAVNDLNIEELVANETVRPTLVEEVWSEINQPNWPGVGRA